MLTVDEVGAIPLFSGLPAAELERLARMAADLHLSPGEFASTRAERQHFLRFSPARSKS